MRKTYNILMFIIGIAIAIVIALIVIKYGGNQINEQETQEVVEQIKEENVTKEYKGYEVIGIINIPKIDIEYPILSVTNTEALKLSITRFEGEKVNSIGNLTLAGHNNRDGTMFGKIDELEKGDIIKLTDMTNMTKEYKIYDIFSTNPNNVSVVEIEEYGSREVTLITCSNGNKERLIIKAREAI